MQHPPIAISLDKVRILQTEVQVQLGFCQGHSHAQSASSAHTTRSANTTTSNSSGHRHRRVALQGGG